MKEKEFLTALKDKLWDFDDVKRISTFEDSMLLTRDEGLVVKFHDGTEFQITLVQSEAGGEND